MSVSERASRPPLVFLPGLLCDEGLFTHQIRLLADSHEIITPGVGAADSIEALADDILCSLPGRFIIIGLSMGGRIAHSICTRFPERCAGMVLMATSARQEAEAQSKRREKVARYLERMGGGSRAEEYLPLLFSGYRFSDDDVRSIVYEMAGRIPVANVIAQMRAMVNRPDFRPLLHRYNFPVLLLVGDRDTDTPIDLHEEMAGLIAGSRLEIIPDCGHLPPLEQPGAVNQLLEDWLAEIGQTAGTVS
jgi:pimeloyl-ACP methyl ester carboxylesterase